METTVRQTTSKKDFDKQIAELLKGRKITNEEITNTIESISSKYNVPIQRVCSYGRVSTKHDEQESSLITQSILFHKYCESHKDKGYVLVEEIYDQKTGTLASKRKRFIDMIERAKAGEFNVILFKDSKRMCRNTEEFLSITEELKRLDIACVFISEGVNSLTADRTTLAVLGMVAESHSNGLHDSVKIAKRINMEREEGRVPSYIFGYSKPKNNDSTEIYIDPKEAELVKELFDRYVNLNEGVSTIVADWRSRGIKSKLGNDVSSNMLNKMLERRLYIGMLDMGLSYKTDVRDKRHFYLQPQVIRERPDLRIIDDELFQRAQEKKKLIKETRGHMDGVNRRTAFSGKIQCECCGKNFKKFRNGVGDKRTHYYKCSTIKQYKEMAINNQCDNKSYFRKDEILDSLSVYFKQILDNRDDLEKLIRNSVINFFRNLEENVDTNSLLLEIEKAREDYKRYQNLYLEGLWEDINVIKQKKKALDDLLAKQSIIERNASVNFDVDNVVKKLFRNIEELVTDGINNIDNASEQTIVKFNSLFHSIIATNDNRLVFNLNGSTLISTLSNADGNRYNSKCIYTEPLFSEGQLRVLEQSDLFFIPLNNLFDYNELYAIMNSIRNKDTTSRRRYRYSERYRGLGKSLIDSVNIVL